MSEGRIIEPYKGEIREQIGKARKAYVDIDLSELEQAEEQADKALLVAAGVGDLVRARIEAIRIADQNEYDTLRNQMDWQQKRIAAIEATAAEKGINLDGDGEATDVIEDGEVEADEVALAGTAEETAMADSE